MDINQYANRVKFKSLPADFNHQDGKNFKSSWDYVKETFSTYHFDKFKEEQPGEWYHPLGRFVGDWSDAVPQIIEKSRELSWSEQTAKGLRPGWVGGMTPMKEQEDYDRQQVGGEHIEQTLLVLENFIDQFPKIKAMVDYWGLDGINGKPSYRAHVQWPGQFFGVHMDKLQHRCPEDPGRVVRMILSLSDYEPGQLLLYGNSVLTQWKAGDIHIFDHHNVPHATVNLSSVPRPNITITGLRTPEFDAKLAEATADSRYPV